VHSTRAVERLNIRLRLATRALDSVSPLATLDRGYAIVSDEESGAILSDAAKVSPGASIRAQLARGALRATVNESTTDKKDDS
jgi:exodeoxyribonuclease VII large subunit